MANEELSEKLWARAVFACHVADTLSLHFALKPEAVEVARNALMEIVLAYQDAACEAAGNAVPHLPTARAIGLVNDLMDREAIMRRAARMEPADRA